MFSPLSRKGEYHFVNSLFANSPFVNQTKLEFSRNSLLVFPARSCSEQFWNGQKCPLFDVVHPAFSLPTRAAPTLQGAMKDGFGEAVVACDRPEPCKFPSLDSCQKRFLWTHKEVDLAPHPVVGLVLQAGNTTKFPYALGFENERRKENCKRTDDLPGTGRNRWGAVCHQDAPK